MNATERANYDRAERLIRNEVYVCLSSLVSTLAAATYHVPLAGDIYGLCAQASDLCAPLLDYEEAARYQFTEDTAGQWHRISDPDDTFSGTAEELCETYGIGPYEHEIYEHWSISQSLADDLAELGERIDTDFAGMCVWGRTTTGQHIAMDSIIANVLALHDQRLASIRSA